MTDDETTARLAELNARGVTAPIELSCARPETIAFWAKTTLAAMPARVQIIHVRTPDETCDNIVYLDGKRIEADEENIDPGAGHMASDWYERISEAREDRSEYGKAVFDALNDTLSSTYIEDDIAEMDVPCPGCGHHWDDHFGWDWPIDQAYGPGCDHEPFGAGTTIGVTE